MQGTRFRKAAGWGASAHTELFAGSLYRGATAVLQKQHRARVKKRRHGDGQVVRAGGTRRPQCHPSCARPPLSPHGNEVWGDGRRTVAESSGRGTSTEASLCQQHNAPSPRTTLAKEGTEAGRQRHSCAVGLAPRNGSVCPVRGPLPAGRGCQVGAIRGCGRGTAQC